VRKLPFLAAAIATLMSIPVHADFLDLIIPNKYNDYPYNYPESKAQSRFEIIKRGSTIGIIDIGRKITYRLDVTDKRAQAFPQKFIDEVMHSERRGNFGKLIQAVTATDTRVDGNRLVSTINVYIATAAVFGGMEAVIQMDAVVDAMACDVYSPGGNGNSYIASTCLKVQVGKNIKLASVETGLPAAQNQLVATVLEFVVKMAAPPAAFIANLYEMK